MSSIGPQPSPGAAVQEEQRKRRRAALTLLAGLLLIAAWQVVFLHDWSYLWKFWLINGGLALYWLWLSSPSFGSAQFEAIVTKHAVTAVPLAFLVGAFLALLVTP